MLLTRLKASYSLVATVAEREHAASPPEDASTRRPRGDLLQIVDGLDALHKRTRGSPRICVALLDGAVDTSHPCFDGAKIERVPTLVKDDASASSSDEAPGPMASHGTHIASLLFGQTGSAVEGIAPGCRGLVVPIFSDERRYLSQMDLARAITQAAEAGAHVISISGGQKVEGGHADALLDKAIALCRERNVLIVAAAGNDGCDCLHVPAALPRVLAVGAMDADGRPLESSNWGSAHEGQGIVAPGQSIRGAAPGGGTALASGTSFATPVVAGIAALLLSLQVERGEEPDPAAVREALLESALPCASGETRCLAGRLSASGAMDLLTNGESTMSQNLNQEPSPAGAAVRPSGCTCGGAQPASSGARPAAVDDEDRAERAARPKLHVEPSGAGGGLVYGLGVLGYDFGTEARRDSFKQLMPPVSVGGVPVPSNPYDARQMVDYLKASLSEAKVLTWTLNLELTPLYALEPVGPFARDVYEVLQRLLEGQVQPESARNWIERVSIPGRLSGRSARLFSGQVVPVIELEATRGLYGWNVNALQDAAMEAVKKGLPQDKEARARKALTSFLYQVYNKLRNLGQSSTDRALNFAATNAFQVASVFSEAVGAGMELDQITVTRSPFCRMDSDCWDVTLVFFDAENLMRARKSFQFTVDVSDVIPVTLGEVRSWSSR